jgi:hypothetical protein
VLHCRRLGSPEPWEPEHSFTSAFYVGEQRRARIRKIQNPKSKIQNPKSKILFKILD